MSLKLVATLFAAGALAAPASKFTDFTARSELRLVKASPSDPGQWVKPENEFELFTSKGINFIDVTDIKDPSVLKALSQEPENSVTANAVTYPSELSHVEEANALIGTISIDNPKSWIDHLASYHTRDSRSETGTQAAAWIFGTVKEAALSNSAITVEQFSHSFNQPSVIARLPGKTEDLVIAGAHFDSTSGSATSRSPGADDNGTGTTILLESLRVLAKSGFTPENTIEFHFYGGEESGLLGSAAVFADYKSKGKSVVSYFNQDMAGYSPSGTPALITDYVDSGLTEFVKLLVTEYTGKAPNSGKCGYGCSDHASATSNGFPSAFLFEDLPNQTSPYIHTPNDTPDTIQWDAVERHIKTTIGYLVEASYIQV